MQNLTLPIPANEEARLQHLLSYRILDTEPDADFDRITKLAAYISESPIALISLIDCDRQWFKSRQGLDAECTPRDISFCQFAIMNDGPFIVENALEDERFKDNPLVVGPPNIRFYAGFPLTSSNGYNLGTLCVIDTKPRKLSPEVVEMMVNLSCTVMDLFELRAKSNDAHLYSQFFEMSLDMLCVAGTDAYFKRINPAFCKILGWSEQELLSVPFLDFVHPDDIEPTLEEVKRLEEGHLTVDFTNRYKKKDGGYVWMHWTCRPNIETGDLYAAAHDISILKQAEEEMKKVINYKDVFMSNMSHEIRTPMNAIIGFSGLLSQTKLTEEQREYIEAITISSENLLVLINDILDLSKIDAGMVQLEQVPLSIRTLLSNVVKIAQPKAGDKSIALKFDLDQDIPEYILGDGLRLTQILVNLINNAIKFTESGEVKVRAGLLPATNKTAYKIRFEIEDTGIGMDSEELERIFERFEQASKSTTRKYGGTGLGLSIVKMLVELHGGELAVRSVKGKGSTFSFDISFKPTRVKARKELGRIDIMDKLPLQGLRVLIVEDNRLNQKLAGKLLEKNGAAFDIAENGKLGVEAVQNGTYDLVLMDLQMPEMDGYDATMCIRKDLGSKIPIVACTAHSLVGEKDKCLEIGMDAYVPKPFSEQEFIMTIRQVLSGTKA